MIPKPVLWALICLVPATPVFSQREKSVVPVKVTPQGLSGITRAVVIGISDYQDPAITDLLYADRDAETFARFLQSPAGGNLDQSRLRLLINEQATQGQVFSALYWLKEESREGDRAVIYFSGHGDVERRFHGQPGFLLCWDALSSIYMAGGTIELGMLQTVISTLTLENKASVILIADACHAGKLAGSSISGPQLTNAGLAEQFNTAVKILSCQPNELSLEGEQWGGGRGLFSYYLTDGLYGMADMNGDSIVNLLELSRYLEDNTSREGQIPVITGDRTQQLATVVPAILRELKKHKSVKYAQFAPAAEHGLEEQLMVSADSNLQKDYSAYLSAIKEKRFLEPAGNCADFYYGKLMQYGGLGHLQKFIKRNYAAALQDDAQQAINKLMKVDIKELDKTNAEALLRNKSFPGLLARAAELLGSGHYMYPILKARELLFEGLLIHMEKINSRVIEDGQAAIDKYRESLKYQPEMPATHYYMSMCFDRIMNQPDSALVHAVLATKYAETWVLPYAHLAFDLSMRYHRFPEAKDLLDKALKIDSSNAVVWIGFGAYFFYQLRLDDAEESFRHALQLDSTFALGWANLGISYLTMHDYGPAEMYLRKAIHFNPQLSSAYYGLGCMFGERGKNREAMEMYLKTVRLNPFQSQARDSLARMYLDLKMMDEAEDQLNEIAKSNPANSDAWYSLACISAVRGRTQQALERLEKALEKNRFSFDSIQNDERLRSIRNEKDYKLLLRKKFPDQFRE